MITGLGKVALAVGSRSIRKHLFRLGEPILGGPVHESDRQVTDAHTMIIKGLAQAQLFDVENVNAWVNQMGGGQRILETIEGLPCCLPLYPYTYLEWPEDGLRCAALVACAGILDPSEDKMAMIFSFDIGPDAAYCSGTAHIRFTPEGTVIVPRDDDGNVRGIVGVASEEVYDIVKNDPSLAQNFHEGLAWSTMVALFAFSLLHCTNVHVIEVDPRHLMTRQQRRDLERRKKDPILYKVLEIKPLGGYRRAAAAEGEGRRKRLHHVRGHFVEYGEAYGKGKLFGRYEGRFFVPPHVRGDLEEGVVAKIYTLGKPTGKEDLTRWRKQG